MTLIINQQTARSGKSCSTPPRGSRRFGFARIPEMKNLVFICKLGLLSLVFAMPTLAQWSPAQAGAVQYGDTSVASGDRANLAAWNAANLQVSVGGAYTWNVGTPWLNGYNDAELQYPDGVVPFIYAVANINGWPAEDLILHYKQDFRATGPGWNFPMDQFDVFEESGCPFLPGGGSNCGAISPARAVHGSWIYDGSNYIDVSAPLYTGCRTCSVPNNGYVYLGYQEPFDLATFTMSIGRGGGSVVWQYWNGTTWADLTTAPVSGGTQNFVDRTNGLSASGKVTWYPPKDWARTQVNSVGNNKYWIRVGPNGASTAPKISTVKGDNWKSTVGTACTNCGSSGATNRGWDPTGADGDHVNVGNTCGSSGTQACQNLEYDPSPPLTSFGACNNQPCSARFRYQGRASGYAGNSVGSQTYYNQGRQIGGVFTTGDIVNLVRATDDNQFLLGITGSMNDDTGTVIATTPAFAEPLTDISSETTWQQGVAGSLQRYVSLVPSGWIVGLNIGNKAAFPDCFVPGVSWCMHELSPSTFIIGLVDYITKSPSIYNGAAMQDYAPAVNPTGVKGLFEATEYAHFGVNASLYGSFYESHTWDEMRGFTLLHAYFDIGWNPNVIFGIWSGSNAGKDDVYVWDTGHASTLSAALPWNCTQTAKTIQVTSDAGWTTVGGDDNNVYGYYVLRIGADHVKALKTSSGVYTTQNGGSMIAGNIPNTVPACSGGSYPVGTPVQFLYAERQSNPNTILPNISNIGWFAGTFPAEAVNIGVPDTVNGWQPPGLNRGDPDLAYVNTCTNIGHCHTGCKSYPCPANLSSNTLGIVASAAYPACGTPHGGWAKYCSPIYRRSFTSAEVYVNPWSTVDIEDEIDVPGVTIPLGTTLYPLLPDGTTGPGVTSIQLRANEAFIGMHNPI